MEVALNDEVIARRVVGDRGVVLAIITWIRGGAVDPTPGESVDLDVGTDSHRPLVIGDRVRIRMLGAGSESATSPPP